MQYCAATSRATSAQRNLARLSKVFRRRFRFWTFPLRSRVPTRGMLARLPKNNTATVKHTLIAAMALYLVHTLLTRNLADFKIYAGLTVERCGDTVD